MGSNAKKITVNCGTTHVSVSVFSEKAGSLVLEKLVVEDLVYNYTEEEEWAAAASGVLSGIFKSLKLNGAATVIAPGHLILTKNVKVPQVEASRQRQIISFEAADKFPFPLSELVWDDQIISTDGVEAEVVLFAMKRENAERFAQQMMRAGITPEIVQPSTNLDYQAYRFLRNGEEPENVLIVNVGARTTNLTFVTQEGFNIQNIAVGGNFLTQAVADSLGKPFPAAERLKVNYFSGAMDVAEDDPHVLKMQENAQAFCRRLSQEITRRIVNQKRQNAAGAPTKILLTGRGSLLPGLSEALADSQRLPVDYLDLTALVRVAGVDPGYFDSVRFQLSEVIGDASELLDSSYKQVNLLPSNIASDIAFSKKKPFFIAAAALFAIAPWPVFLGLCDAGSVLEKDKSVVLAEKAKLEARRDAIDGYEKKNAPLAAYVETLDQVLDSRGAWNEFLADIQSRIDALQAPAVSEDGEKTFPADRHVWIDELRVSRSSQIPVAAGDGEDSDAPGGAFVKTEVRLKLRLLIPEVDGIEPKHNPTAFNKRRKAVLDAFKKSAFVEKISDQADISRPNLPTLTLTLVLKPEKGI